LSEVNQAFCGDEGSSPLEIPGFIQTQLATLKSKAKSSQPRQVSAVGRKADKGRTFTDFR
jgi:hypothetical protein